jgi:DNA-binding NarL/FixJ family response regulator
VIRVIIADDQDLIRGGLRMILEAQDDLQVVAEAATGAAAVRLCHELVPDLVLMDVQMPEMDGIEATRQIVRGLPDQSPDQAPAARTQVLVLTTFDRDDYVYAALRAGASGFLLKTAPPLRLVEAVRLVAAGEALLAPSVTRRLIEQHLDCRVSPPNAPAISEVLTPREIEVVTCIARGMSNAEIANELMLGEATVKTHVNRILSKLQLRDRVHVVVFAYDSGLVQAGFDGG